MSGKILIVDAVATNRIVLKVKLSAAHFDVHQASTGCAAIAAARDLDPDLIILGTTLSDMSCSDLIDALRARADLATVPIAALLPEDTGPARIAALEAGADDVIAHPIDERMMLARLRGLLRQHLALQDMRLNAGPDRAAGFGEAQAMCLRPGRITILGPRLSDAMALRTRLRSVCRHQVTALPAGGPVTGAPGAPAADVFVLMIPEMAEDGALGMMAELRGSPEARHGRIVCILPGEAGGLAASLLDMGANDVIAGHVELDEMTLRLGRQIQRKQAVDHLRARLHDGLRAAMIDPLTGLYNRRFAMPFLKGLALSDGGSETGFAVMLADLDHFKRINDRLGHAAGDRVLCHVADILGSNLRDVDMVARIGGEEFLIVMPGADGAEARTAADRLCQRIGEATITLRGQPEPARVTVSIGVAMGWPQLDEQRAGAHVDALLEEADRALYRAKARGRNTVTVGARPAA